MDFERFTKWGVLSNWGWYSPAEKALLAKELAVSQAFKQSEKFVKKETFTISLFVKFMDIRLNNSVKTSEIPAIDRELDGILAGLKEHRLETLDKLGPDAPGASAPFKNHQPDALVGEIRSYLAVRKKQGHNGDPLKSSFVIHLNLANVAPTLEQFQTVINSGAKVLWTLDVENILSIGDPQHAKHSVVAVGKDVQAAGIAQLKISDKKDMYLAIENYKQRITEYRRQYEQNPEDLYLQQIETMQKDVDLWQETLGDWTPEHEAEPTVVLDFDSGHYTPSAAWGPAAGGWNKAGYKVEWSRTARHV